MELKDRVAIVTGAGGGLGEAVAVAFGTAGAKVVCLDARGQEAQRVHDRIEAEGANSLGIEADVSDALGIEAATRLALDRFGRVDVLVNNAGIDFTLPITELTVEQWDRVLAVNLRGPFLFSKAVFPHMRAQGGGHIVNISSTAGKRAWANAAAYHASKWGLIGLTRALGVEGRPYNIRASLVVPGGMNTPFFDRLEVRPDPRNLQDPAHVAKLIVFLVSQPDQSVIQEVIVTPLTETSWP